MKYRSQLVTAASGSVGGCVFSRNRFGSYIRNRALPVNVASSFQNILRGAMATLVVRWTSVLTALQRSGWETWAANTPQVDSIGQTYNMTGQNAYISMNTMRIQVGLSIIDTSPTIYAGAALTPPGITSITAATGIMIVTFTNTDIWATAVGGALLAYGSRGQNQSKLFFAGPYRFASRINGSVVPPTSPQNIALPFAPAVGNRVHVRFRCLNANGQISAFYRLSAIAI